jgi:hypothetical protein
MWLHPHFADHPKTILLTESTKKYIIEYGHIMIRNSLANAFDTAQFNYLITEVDEVVVALCL